MREVVESDWVRENGMADSMNQEKFGKSLFELVDTWSGGIKLVEYRMFLQKLYHRITASASNSGKDREKYNRRIKELEKQRLALNKNKAHAVERINDLTAQAKNIAVEAKQVRKDKLEAEAAQVQLALDTAKAKQKMKMLEDIMNEKVSGAGRGGAGRGGAERGGAGRGARGGGVVVLADVGVILTD